MKRLAIITVGKTHSGKSTFARKLEKNLANALVMDQDNHARFIHSYYQKLQPDQGSNTLKHSISKLIVDYAKEHTNLHIIASNANRTRAGRRYLLEEIYNQELFTRVLVHFDISEEILRKRVNETERSTDIFRGAYQTFVEVLNRQEEESFSEDVREPNEEEADHLFKLTDNDEMDVVIEQIVQISKHS